MQAYFSFRYICYDIICAVHGYRVILVNNQLDAQFFLCMFISILYMFREAMCPSSEELIVSLRHLVCVTVYS
jgi:hypothetical protein